MKRTAQGVRDLNTIGPRTRGRKLSDADLRLVGALLPCRHPATHEEERLRPSADGFEYRVHVSVCNDCGEVLG